MAMVIKRENRVRHNNSENCTAFEYPMDDEEINIAEILINGRYPDRGRVVNEEVREMVFVVRGEGRVVVEGEEHGLEGGDAILLLPGQKYFFEGNNLRIISACTPAWRPQQHKNL